MVALPLLDILMSSDRAERATSMAGQLAEASLRELQHIQAIEQDLAPAGLENFDRPMAALIRGMYEQWAHEAQSLVARIRHVEQRFGSVGGATALADALGRTLAMLSISLDDMETGRRDIIEGRLFSAEEVRRELHISTQ